MMHDGTELQTLTGYILITRPMHRYSKSTIGQISNPFSRWRRIMNLNRTMQIAAHPRTCDVRSIGRCYPALQGSFMGARLPGDFPLAGYLTGGSASQPVVCSAGDRTSTLRVLSSLAI